jgi:hypothetical protein
MKNLTVALVAVLACAPAGAHHSYANYQQDERYVFSGTLTEVLWGNPHILLHISDGVRTMKVEWITVNGADNTGVAREQFAVGEQITVTGSRHRNPDVATIALVKEVAVPARQVHWVYPTGAPTPAYLREN